MQALVSDRVTIGYKRTAECILSESGGRFTDHFTAPLSAWAKTRNIEYFTDWEN